MPCVSDTISSRDNANPHHPLSTRIYRLGRFARPSVSLSGWQEHPFGTALLQAGNISSPKRKREERGRLLLVHFSCNTRIWEVCVSGVKKMCGTERPNGSENEPEDGFRDGFDNGSHNGSKDGFKSGFVTLVGRPNVGKSTLINAVVGHKVAITSATAQTTRHRFRAILTREDMQMVMVDTPGLHKPHDALGKELNASAIKALEDVDVVAFLVDASQPVGRGDAWVAAQVKAARDSKKLLVISKADLVDSATAQKQLEGARSLGQWDDEIVLSSKENFNVDGFVDAVRRWFPEGPRWFPDNMDTDQPFEVIIAEFIREKILRSYRDEVPHSIGVDAARVEYDSKSDMYRIYAVVYVERESQKGIIIGRGGAAIKQVGIEARQDLEHLLGCKVFLDTQVKVRKNWRRDLSQIRRFGYGEGI